MVNAKLITNPVRKSWRGPECTRILIRRRINQRAFTAIELLVIIMVVGLGITVLAPAIARTQPASKTFQCLYNNRLLVNVWRMYSADNNDRVANNFGVAETTDAINSGRLDNWVNNVMTWSASLNLEDRSNTNQAWVTNGVMGKYADAPVSAYHCPADTTLSNQQKAAGWKTRLRSVAMNSVFGRFSNSASDPTAQGQNWALPQYLQFLKQAQVLKPAKTWLFIEEHPDSLNDGFYLNSTTASSWQDIPASYHNGGCTLSFADGHAEVRKWLSVTSQYSVRFIYPNVRPFDAQGRADFAWYLERTGYIAGNTGLPQFGY